MYHTWKPNDVWFLRYGVQSTEFFVILDHFLPFYPNNNRKKENFEKMRIMPGYVSRYINATKIMIKWSYTKLFLRYKAWQMQFLFFILGYFLPFSPLTTQKNKLKQIWRKKTHLEVSSFYTCVPKIVITMVSKKYGARRMDRQTGGQKK